MATTSSHVYCYPVPTENDTEIKKGSKLRGRSSVLTPCMSESQRKLFLDDNFEIGYVFHCRSSKESNTLRGWANCLGLSKRLNRTVRPNDIENTANSRFALDKLRREHARWRKVLRWRQKLLGKCGRQCLMLRCPAQSLIRLLVEG